MKWALTPRARRDLEDIWKYSAARWGLDQADDYVRALISVVRRIAKDPPSAKACDDIRKGYRRRPSGSHMLFVRIEVDQLVVVRILHQRMDPDRHL